MQVDLLNVKSDSNSLSNEFTFSQDPSDSLNLEEEKVNTSNSVIKSDPRRKKEKKTLMI